MDEHTPALYTISPQPRPELTTQDRSCFANEARSIPNPNQAATAGRRRRYKRRVSGGADASAGASAGARSVGPA
jgi:hypothetical protein